jgi:hypothetical protein
VNLHIADGSQIVSDVANGPRLSINVAARGRERYGSCLTRLAPPRLYGGYLPILETQYVDRYGVRYRQESFATRIPQTRALVSFVRLSVDPRGSGLRKVRLRLTPSVRRLARAGNRLRQGGGARLLFSGGGRFDGSSLVYSLTGAVPRTVYVAWLNRPQRTSRLRLGWRTYLRARNSVVGYWTRRLAAGAELVVPEQRVYDAERNLLIQNMLLSWRYSLGNSYERFSWELVDVAEVMGDYGYRGLERAILETALRSSSYFPNRAAGERMVGSAHYFRRYGDSSYLERVTPLFRRYVTAFDRQLAADPHGLLRPERYGADIARRVYALHGQALALQGLRAMAAVWTAQRKRFLAYEATRVAARLEAGLRAAVSSSQVALPNDSLFVPITLLNDWDRPFDSVTNAKRGSYWNLVMPYVLASGLFRPGSPEARGLFEYMLTHGSRLLGLVRFRPHNGAQNPGYEAPGSDDVYGTNVVRFLADTDEADQLVLSLYGKLGAGMTPETFVSGEGSTIGPVGRRYYRSMHRPPNSANNAFFLEALRLTLVHETSAYGVPQGLELAYATPRHWLRPGQQIAVREAQTSFGPLSYSIDSGTASLQVRVTVPSRVPETLRLRLRLPGGERITRVDLAGRPYDRFDPVSGTIDLSGLNGQLALKVYRGISGGSAAGP